MYFRSYVTRVLWKWFESLVFQTFGRNHMKMWGCYICSWLRMAFRRRFLLAFSKSFGVTSASLQATKFLTRNCFIVFNVDEFCILNSTVGLENDTLFFVCSVKGPDKCLNTGNLLNFPRAGDLITFY